MGVPKDYLAVGNAGDELIDRIIRLFIEKGDVAVSFTPSFAIPRLCVKRQEGEYVTVPLKRTSNSTCHWSAVAVSRKPACSTFAHPTTQQQTK
jgi:histidinol-phosphate/aromatic aminotransferase/cobyric acid decarboxylase-like protein